MKNEFLTIINVQHMISSIVKRTMVPAVEDIQRQLPMIQNAIEELNKLTKVSADMMNSTKIALLSNIPTSAIFEQTSLWYNTLYEENLVSGLFEKEVIKYPYPYSRDTFLRLGREEITESDLIEDLYSKISTGEIITIFEQYSIFDSNFLCNEEILIFLNLFLDRTKANTENIQYDFLWFFPIAEAIAKTYVNDNSVFILEALKLRKNECSNDDDKKELNKLIKILKRFIRKPSEKYISLGNFEKAVGVAIQLFPSANFYYPFLAIKEAIYTRNNIIHGNIFEITTEHIAISLSLLITIINLHLKLRELELIIFNLD